MDLFTLINSGILLGVMGGSVYLYRYQKSQQKNLQHSLETTQAELGKANLSQTELTQKLMSLQSQINKTIADPVTHLMSKQLLESRLKQAISESLRLGHSLSVLMIDINQFRVINEALGYDAGNFVLAEIANRLQTCIRDVDSLARFDKDIFVCLLTLISKPETTVIAVHRILKTFEEPISINGQEIYLTASIGISVCPTDASEVDNLIHYAENALQQVKREGKQKYHFYQEKLHSQSQRELALATSLHSENFFKELMIRYEPIMDVQDEKVFCLEAECYWQNAQFGELSGEEFQFYIDKERLSAKFYEWLFRKTTKQFMEWNALSFKPNYLSIAIPLAQLQHSQFVHQLSQIFQENNFNPSWLMLEIHEESTTVSYDVIEKSLNMLKYLGVKLALNHFGCCSFPLSYLKQLDVNLVKLDKSFVTDIETNQKSQQLISAIFNMMQSLSIPLIVQGVESGQQSQMLKGLGLRYMQGKFIAPALSANEAKENLQKFIEG